MRTREAAITRTGKTTLGRQMRAGMTSTERREWSRITRRINTPWSRTTTHLNTPQVRAWLKTTRHINIPIVLHHMSRETTVRLLFRTLMLARIERTLSSELF